MRIERLDVAADADSLQRCREIVAACQRADDPELPTRSAQAFEAWWSRGFGGDPRQAWLATGVHGGTAGCYLLTLPEHENTATASCALYVPPDGRRSGQGTRLLAHCAEQASAAGRSRLEADIRDDSPGAAFAAKAGAQSGMAEVFRRLTVDDSVSARLPSLRSGAEQRSAGYSLLPWTGLTPDDVLPDAMRLSVAMADAPRDEGLEPELWDAERIIRFERAAIEAGQQFYAVAARHDQTGRLTAISQLRTDPGSPGWAFQGLTAVLGDHRGHRLGLLTKVAMLEWLGRDRPDVRHIMTSNAGPNDHMIAINEQLGFQVVSVHRRWEIALPLAATRS